jgi:hypothetical protein
VKSERKTESITPVQDENSLGSNNLPQAIGTKKLPKRQINGSSDKIM